MGPVRAAIYAVVFLAACLLDIAIQDAYFRLATETPRALILLGAVCVVATTLLICAGRHRSSSDSAALLAPSWALSTWMALVLLPLTGLLSGISMALQLCSMLVLSTAACVALPRRVRSLWRRAGAAACVASVLFVVGQPVLVGMAGENRSWPPAPPVGTDARNARLIDPAGRDHEATVFLLLDELNPSAADSFRADLRSAGLSVTGGVVPAESDATAKVIPAMWTGLAFDHARPCSATAICSGGQILDFAKVTVTRPDVDIVGFYHPYCAMVGLRSCRRVEASVDLLDSARWWCGVRRRLGGHIEESCRNRRYAHWLEVRSGVIKAVWAAPIWSQGGLLYVHVPLPHPPGSDDGGTLRQDYADNVSQAREFVRELAHRLQAAGFSRVQLVLFSDHPLRAYLWCQSASYLEPNCVVDNQVASKSVPLLLASSLPLEAELATLRTNRDIFQLRARAGGASAVR